MNGTLIKAEKFSSRKLFKNSLPFQSIGYSGIASCEYGKFSSDSFLSLLDEMEKEDLLKIKTKVSRLLLELAGEKVNG